MMEGGAMGFGGWVDWFGLSSVAERLVVLKIFQVPWSSRRVWSPLMRLST